jgi:hypothetical protein
MVMMLHAATHPLLFGGLNATGMPAPQTSAPRAAG